MGRQYTYKETLSMSTNRPGSMNTEARALASILLDADRNVSDAYLQAERDLAAEARAGGRLLTHELARFGGPAVSRQMMAEDPAKAWHYHIDTSGSYDWADPRREQEAKEGWARRARAAVDGSENRTYMGSSHPMVYLPLAEEMVGWPIYRAGVIAQLRDTIDSTGRSTMRGLTSEQLDQIDELGSRLGPIVNGERFAPGYTPEAAEYEQRTR